MRLAAAAVLACAACVAHAARVVPTPAVPAFGQAVSVELRELSVPVYIPATRYTRAGFNIVVEYEQAPSDFGPWRPDFGQPPALWLGELPPGEYNVEARLFRMDTGALTQTLSQKIAVPPPERWGIYTLPQSPDAFTPLHAVVKSAVYIDPASMRASLSGNVVRVDFDYDSNGFAIGTTSPNGAAFGSVAVPALAPGHYVLEGWGRDKSRGVVERYFTTHFAVASAIPVVEYYSPETDHYFMTASSGEQALVDAGGRGAWKRTGGTFKGWARAADAPPSAKPVCRFYAHGPRSHFYTADPGECDFLKALEVRQRAEAQARGEPFLGWAFEHIAFYALLPENGQCAAGMRPVHRAYNDRAAQNDPNHRFTTDALQRFAMSMSSWIDEGTAFCSPP